MAKRVLITGANTGIGKATAVALAERGMEVVMACRNRDRGESARKEIVRDTGNSRVDLLIVDLASLDSIRQFATEFRARYDRLDLLVNNAGISLTSRRTSADGYEMVFAVNHLGPFLLTNLLLELLKRSAPSRIVNVASSVHKNARFDPEDLQKEHNWEGRDAYACSKYLNVLFTYELSRRLGNDGVTANCFNPGLVRSEFFRDYSPVPFMLRVVLKLIGRTPEEGARTAVYLATDPRFDSTSGRYFQNDKEIESAPGTYDPDLAAKIWDYSSTLVADSDDSRAEPAQG